MFFSVNKVLLIISCAWFVLSGSNPVSAWDRFANETSSIVWTSTQATEITRYYFSLSSTTTLDFYTDDLSPLGTGSADTYMHIWSKTKNCEMAHNDDGNVPSGNPYASRITATLPAGSYIIFVRAWCANNYDVSHVGRCSLYKNGFRVLYNEKFGGQELVIDGPEGSRLQTANVPSNGDTYALLLSKNRELISFADDGGNTGNSLSTRIIDCADKRQCDQGSRCLVIGAYDEGGECLCDIQYTPDEHFEFLATYGTEYRHYDACVLFSLAMVNYFGYNCFNTDSISFHASEEQYYRSLRLISQDWGSNGVDFLFNWSHGTENYLQMQYGTGITFPSSQTPYGSGDIYGYGSNRAYDGLSGDLEYFCTASCKTVRLKHMNSSSWLDSDRWRTYESSDTRYKGMFEGLHIVLGFHSNHTSYEPLFGDPSWEYFTNKFVGKLNLNKGLWQSWKETIVADYDKYHTWFNGYKPGIGSTIAITSQKDETLSDFYTRDIRYGDSRYQFTWSYYGYGSDIPPN